MEKEQLRKNSYDMIYLVNCAVHGKIPDRQKIDSMDIDSLFEVCQKNSLTACVAYALESAGIQNHDFTQVKNKSIRKNILLDVERNNILKHLEHEKIWYMPLKGALLKDCYPELGMRQMSDNDILYDGDFRKTVRKIMSDMGFSCEHFGKGNHDAYSKEPVLNFEMHAELFSEGYMSRLNEYYKTIKKRLEKDRNNNYGFHFSNEDFYIYMTAHEYKHYFQGGTGVRSLVDTYIFVSEYWEKLDHEYISAELEKLDIADFERQNRELSMKIFTGQKIHSPEIKILDFYIMSGTYGTHDTLIKNSINTMGNGSKAKYIFKRIFPSMKTVKAYWPFFYRNKFLMPVLWFVVRPLNVLTVNRKKIIHEIRYLKKN